MDHPYGRVHRSSVYQGVPRLQGTGRLADDLYLIAHHEVTGRPYLSPRGAGIAAAAALLAELLAASPPTVTVRGGYLLPLHPPSRDRIAQYAGADDDLLGYLADLIAKETSPVPVHDWLLFLGQTAPANVAARLERSGYLTHRTSRLPWRPDRAVPVEADCSHCALNRARRALDATERVTPYHALLATLTLACGLGFRVSSLSSVPARDADQLRRSLPNSLQQLIACVQATADATVLSART